jgi:hypothetical protein
MFVAFCVTAQAEQGRPNQQTLADMGLGSLRVISDVEAQAIRGAGFNPAEFLNGFAHYEQSKAEFRARVKAFQDRIDAHFFKNTASFQKHKAEFQSRVVKFRSKIH